MNPWRALSKPIFLWTAEICISSYWGISPETGQRQRSGQWDTHSRATGFPLVTPAALLLSGTLIPKLSYAGAKALSTGECAEEDFLHVRLLGSLPWPWEWVALQFFLELENILAHIIFYSWIISFDMFLIKILLRYNIILVSGGQQRFNICIYCEMITTMSLLNIHHHI